MSAALRIGVDAACLANGRGYGRFTRELLAALVENAREHQFVLYGDRASLRSVELDAPNLSVVHVAQHVSPAHAAAADGYRSPIDMLRLTRAVWRDRPDVFWSPSVYTYFPLPPGQPETDFSGPQVNYACTRCRAVSTYSKLVEQIGKETMRLRKEKSEQAAEKRTQPAARIPQPSRFR